MNHEFHIRNKVDVLMRSPLYVEVTCPDCGYGIDLWNGTEKTVCPYCGFRVYRHENTDN